MTSDIKERVARMIENDAMGAIKRTLTVAQSDVFALLGEFMTVEKMDMRADGSNGAYKLIIEADVSRFYEVGQISSAERDTAL